MLNYNKEKKTHSQNLIHFNRLFFKERARNEKDLNAPR